MALIYIVEDDNNILEIETIALRNSNYTVCGYENAREFYNNISDTIPDLILLDIMLPDENGYEILQKLRTNPSTKRIPIIMVTAKSSEMDMIRGLDSGADDYIKKPFSIMELVTRVKALLRRTEPQNDYLLRSDNIIIDHERHMVFIDQEQIDLTYKEYELLRYLMLNTGIVMSREAIMLNVWDTDYEGESRTVDMHIKTLRKKMGASGNKIRTVRNVGYVLD